MIRRAASGRRALGPVLLAVGALLIPARLDPGAQAAEILFQEGLGGDLLKVTAAPGDSLVELARRHDLGFNEIEAANPGTQVFLPEPGSEVVIPTRWLLPEVERRAGIVVNVPERRLYYFRPGRGDRVETYPIGVGDDGWDTPLGSFRIVERLVAPAWRVPASIRRQRPELPAVVPAGPENPLGTHALRLSAGSVLIHGTNRPFGIGRRVSHGCIHLYPEDIVALFPRVKVGTAVQIVAQPVKAAWAGGRVLLEVHGEEPDLEEAALALLEARGLAGRADSEKVRRAARERLGIPVDVTAESAVRGR